MPDGDYDALSPMFNQKMLDPIKHAVRGTKLAMFEELARPIALRKEGEIPDYDDPPPPPEYMEDDEGRAYLDGEPLEYWLEENPNHPAADFFSDHFKNLAQTAARKAFDDNEGTYKDTGDFTYREAKRGNTIHASAEPRWDYEYNPAALRQAEMDTKRDKRQYEAERTRKGQQDPAPTLGPSMTE